MATKLSRRDFIRLCAGSAAAISLTGFLAPYMQEAVAAGTAPPVIWVQGASCTGCSISLLNTVHPDIQEVLTKIISLKYHPMLWLLPAIWLSRTQCSKLPRKIKVASSWWLREPFLLVLMDVLHRWGRKRQPITFQKLVQDIGGKAKAILNFGPVHPMAESLQPAQSYWMQTGIRSCQECAYSKCAWLSAPSRWMVGTIAHVLLYNDYPEVDTFGRPKMFFSNIIMTTAREGSISITLFLPRILAKWAACLSWAAKVP
jgi:hydrogenase small subunit